MTLNSRAIMQRQLLAIGEARKVVALTELAEAEQNRIAAAENAERARHATVDAFEVWSDCVGSRLLGAEGILGSANRLLAADSALTGADKRSAAAEREADASARKFQSLEASQRAGSDRCTRDERDSARKLEERRTSDTSDLLLARKHGWR